MSETLDIIRRTNPADDYELLQRVGSGTYGEVYKGRHIRTGELAAIKEVKLQPGDNFALIQQEILMLSECHNENIIAYFGSYLRRDRLWIVMEYCGGGSLQDIYHMVGPLSELQIAFCTRETLKGLNYLHSMGKIHRDVKGANILLSNHGDVKLADFGVAAQITATIAKRKSFIGTPYWMAPEVAAVETKGGYGPACDVWAVGITAIELAELQPPLFDLHPMRVLALMTKSSYKSPTLKDRIKWSPYFHDFVKQCLIKNAKKRPSPQMLLQSHSFIQGALTARLTRDLLDRVNNPSGAQQRQQQFQLQDEYSQEDQPNTSVVPRRIPSRAPADDDVKRSNIVRPISQANIDASNIKDNARDHPRQLSYHESRTLPKHQTPPDLIAGLTIHDQPRCLNDDDEIQNHDDATLTRGERSPMVVTPEGSTDEINDRFQHDATITNQPRNHSNNTITFGLPPTPKVTMGACYSKIFHGCPLRLNCSTSWTHSETKEQLVLLGAEEGIYALNLNELHEASMQQVHPRRCTWLYVIDDVLMALQGKTPHVYRHDLTALFQRNFTTKLSLTMNKVPERFVPRKLAVTTRVNETKNCFRCCVQKNPFNGNIYLCALVPNMVVLMQWYKPLQKFMIIKEHRCAIQLPARIFELLISADSMYPIVCSGVRKGATRKSFALDLIDLNNAPNPHAVSNGTEMMRRSSSQNDIATDRLPVTALRQIARDVLIICIENKIHVTNLHGRIKCWANTEEETNTQSPPLSALVSLKFDRKIDDVVCLSDSVLALDRHGLQGRSLQNGELNQDIYDQAHVYRLLGKDGMVLLECQDVQGVLDAGVDLCLLTGHESTM